MLTDSLIVWNEASEDSPEGVDLAISFQEAAGCTDIWYALCLEAPFSSF